jgi:CRISPR-associated endonuclease Csn1
MVELTLGLDLGPNSIGWVLLDEGAARLIGVGARVFPEGVKRDTKGAEVPKMQQRRLARAMRRQIARRARRRRALRRVLVAAGLLPECALLAAEDKRRVDWERDEFRREDPYSLRARALRQDVKAHEIGRVLVHLCQHRGFKSNRKTDRARKKENSDLLAEISALDKELGDRTLGQYLAEIRGDDPQRFHLIRLRGRHTHREMYEKEFDAIWAAQQVHHPSLLTKELRERVHRVIFFQRDLRPPSPALVGRCELEPRLPRCPRADRRAQRFRLFQEVNNLRVLDMAGRTERKLTDDERAKLLAYLATTKERKFDDIRKHLFDQYETIRFNLEQGGRSKLKGMPTDAALAQKSMVGKAWHKLSEDCKDRIVAATIDDNEDRLRHLLNEAGLDVELVGALLEQIDLEQSYASYSLHAIKRLLPHLEQGLPLTSRDPQIPCALRAAGYIMPWEHTTDRRPCLPEPPMVTNPLVRQALHEVRKVVNAILRELVYKDGHTLARIHIELAREVRGTAEQRRKLSLDMRDREAVRADAADRIREYGVKPTRDAIDRYLLWKEQGENCVYSDRHIGIAQLLGGEVDIDHILPYPRSLDDSLMNKVVCFRSENSQGVNPSAKGDRTPHEWLAAFAPQKYERVLQRARDLPYPKLKRFYQESVELTDFFARQFVDTAYITTQVQQYVQCLGAVVVCPKGQHTAQLRWHWGLDTVLSELADSPAWQAASNFRPGEKNRADHRHHAIDAVVIALTNESRLQQLAAIRRAGGTETTGEVLPDPWPHFRQTVKDAIAQVKVSHRVSRRVSGALHEDTVYGPTKTPGEYTYRKPLVSLSPAMIDNIRDPAIRRLVVQRLQTHKIDPATAKKIPAEVWKEPLCMPPGIPVNKVRLLKRDESIRPIRGGTACVKPGSLHHLCLFEFPDTKGRRAREATFVTMLEALGRVRTRQSVLQQQHPTRSNADFLMSLSANEMLLLEHNGREDLYRFETAASTSEQMWFRHHTFAGKSSDKRGQVSKQPGTFRGRKVIVDPLGRIRWAND